jgi:hypothetical protein
MMKKIQLQILFLVAFTSGLFADSRGSAISTEYLRDNTKDVVYDTKNGLMWQDDEMVGGTTPTSNLKTWEAAIAYCEALTLGDYTDWRMPNFYELNNLVDRTTYYPALPSAFEDKITNPSDPNNYWSSTTDKIATDAMLIDFADGQTDGINPKSETNYVRCVRTTR